MLHGFVLARSLTRNGRRPKCRSSLDPPSADKNFKLENQSNETDLTMKKLLVGFALATLVASPAFAQTRHTDVVPAASVGTAAPPLGASAAMPNDSTDVIKDGHVIGRDPDPAIRTMIFKGSVPVG
jgi:hypothetical protein